MSSNYTGRRAPNATHYLSSVEGPVLPPTDEDNFNFENSLSLFTNGQFFDYETGRDTNFQTQPAKIDTEAAVLTASPADLSVSNMNYGLGDFNFDFNTFTAPGLGFDADSLSIQQMQAPLFPAQIPQQQQQQPQPQQQAQQSTFIQAVPQQNIASKSKVELSLEERSRIAAEEDKRRRNTAASARFRVKKKQREQALEKSAREMTDRVTKLENHIKHLETENKWLKNILLDKVDPEQVEAILATGYATQDENDESASLSTDVKAEAAAVTTV